MKMLFGEILFIPQARAFRPSLPSLARFQHAANSAHKFLLGCRINGQAGIRGTDDFPSGIGITHDARRTESHRFSVSESEAFTPARHDETSCSCEKLIPFVVAHVSPKADRSPATPIRQPFEIVTQTAVSDDPQFGFRIPLADNLPCLNYFAMPLVILACFHASQND